MKKTNKRRIFIWICVSAIVVGFVSMGFFSWSNLKTSPRYSLYQMYQAIEKTDYKMFNQYIDIEAVIQSIILESSQPLSFISESEGMDSVILDFSPVAKDLIQKELKTRIEKGEFFISENLKITSLKDILKIWNTVEVKMVEEIAHVTVPDGKDKEITFHMKQKGELWQIIALEIDEGLLNVYFEQTGQTQEDTENTKQLEKFVELKAKGKEAIETDKLSEGIILLEEALEIKYDKELTEWLNEAYFERAEYFYSIGEKEKAIEDLSKIYPISNKAEELLRQMEER